MDDIAIVIIVAIHPGYLSMPVYSGDGADEPIITPIIIRYVGFLSDPWEKSIRLSFIRWVSDKFLDENPYDPVFGAEKRRTGDAPATPREDKTRTRIRRDETSDAADSRYRAAVAMRVLEKRTLLSAARLLVQELDDALAEETCRERYARTREETRDCLARASGEAFDAFDARESAEEENGGGVRSEDGPGNERREASAGSARGGEL